MGRCGSGRKVVNVYMSFEEGPEGAGRAGGIGGAMVVVGDASWMEVATEDRREVYSGRCRGRVVEAVLRGLRHGPGSF